MTTIILDIIAIITFLVGFTVLGTCWAIYYKQYVQPFGWFALVDGKVSFLANVALCSVFWWGIIYYMILQIS